MVKYHTRIVTFPGKGVLAGSVQNKDGTFTIYVNSRYTEEEQSGFIADMVKSLEEEAAQNGKEIYDGSKKD